MVRPLMRTCCGSGAGLAVAVAVAVGLGVGDVVAVAVAGTASTGVEQSLSGTGQYSVASMGGDVAFAVGGGVAVFVGAKVPVGGTAVVVATAEGAAGSSCSSGMGVASTAAIGAGNAVGSGVVIARITSSGSLPRTWLGRAEINEGSKSANRRPIAKITPAINKIRCFMPDYYTTVKGLRNEELRIGKVQCGINSVLSPVTRYSATLQLAQTNNAASFDAALPEERK